MAINILTSDYTQTSSSQSVTIPGGHNVALIVSVTTNSAPTFDGVAMDDANSYAGSNYYWFIAAGLTSGTYTLAPTGGNTVLNYYILNNVDPVTPLSTQITIPSATFNANSAVYTLNGDETTPLPTWFGVTDLTYTGGIPISATSITDGSILNTVTSPIRIAFLRIPSITTANSYTITYSNTGSGAFAAPYPTWVFLNEIPPPPALVQMIII